MTPGPWLREPLVHFFALGGALFLLFGWIDRDGFQAPDEIVVDSARVETLRTRFERVWQRPPTPDELAGLVDNWIRDEVLYREGLAMGFDRDDPVLRRRIVQKMQFMAESLVDDQVNDAELRAWLRDHPDRYRIDAVYSFRQIYFDPSRHGDTLDEVIAAARDAIHESDRELPGDATLLPGSMTGASEAEVRSSFGMEFVGALAGLPVDEWHGPVPSAYGMHLVRIDERTPGRVPALAEVRPAVERDLLAERSRQAGETFYQAVRERYSVRISADIALARSHTTGLLNR